MIQMCNIMNQTNEINLSLYPLNQTNAIVAEIPSELCILFLLFIHLIFLIFGKCFFRLISAPRYHFEQKISFFSLVCMDFIGISKYKPKSVKSMIIVCG